MSRIESGAILSSGVLGTVYVPAVDFTAIQTSPTNVNLTWLSALPQPSEATLNAVVWSPAIQAQWTEAQVASNVGSVNIKRLTVPRSTNVNPAWQNVTGLEWPLLANKHYAFSFDGAYTTAAATTGLQLAITGPTSPTALAFNIEIAESVTAWRSASVSAYDTGGLGTGSAAATPLPFHVAGTISTGANTGTLQLRFRSEVNGSQVTIGALSYSELKAST